MIVCIRHLSAVAGLVAALVAPPLLAAEDESGRLNAFLDQVHEAAVARWPEWQTNLGLKSNHGKWNDRSDAKRIRELEITIRNLQRLRHNFAYGKLDPTAKISYRLFERNAEESIAWFPYRHYGYVVSQLGGVHNDIPDFLINRHTIGSRADADAYIERLRGIGQVMDQTIARLTASADQGVIPPRFVFPKILADIDGFLTGVPFEAAGADTLLLADFRRKIAKLGLPDDASAALIGQASDALTRVVKPAYLRLRESLTALQSRATDDAGVWKFPDGAAYYALALRSNTTTAMTPDEIHAYGLAEVKRIHAEMRQIATTMGFDGDLKALFDFARNDPSNFYPDDETGRAAYLADSRALLEEMNAGLDRVFSVRPKAVLVVKRVEAFRAKTADVGFYSAPAAYGDRPGAFYANLHDMRRMPKSHLAALAYHEGIPGHHMQIAIAQQLEGLPKFRKFTWHTAFGEGWALYAERLAKEMGFYGTPMSDFGRLSWELLRAARLVVDTGMHHKRWTREQATAYLDETLPVSHAVNSHAIERYIVWPSQATAYKIGMREILALRAEAEARLGEAFDIRDFHRVVLGNGSLPLGLLREVVEQWIAVGGG